MCDPQLILDSAPNRKAVSTMVDGLALCGKQTVLLFFGLRPIGEESRWNVPAARAGKSELLSPLSGRSVPDTDIEGHMEGRRHD